MKKLIVLAAAALFFAGAGSLQAQCTEGAKKACCASKSGATMTEVKKVDRARLSEMIQASAVTVVDARDMESFKEGHIDGALSLAAGANLPENKNVALVFYCGGTRCPLAERAAKAAIADGYKNVHVYSGGWADWSTSNTES